jgi:hypothetical protein
MHRALYVAAGKRGKQSLVAASKCSNSASRLYVTDRLAKTSFLADTGADLCLPPLPPWRMPDTFHLRVVCS